jgi:hypothetical protein
MIGLFIVGLMVLIVKFCFPESYNFRTVLICFLIYALFSIAF